MPLSYHIDTELGILRIVATGDPSFGDQIELSKQWSKDRAYVSGMPILLDNREREEPSTPAEVRDIAKKVQASPVLSQGARCAVIAPAGAEFGMTRMFSMLSEASALETRPFHDEAAALAWLLDERS